MVLASDEIAPAAIRIRADDPRLGEHDDRQDEHNGDRDRHRQRERADPRERENAHRFLGRVGRGRDVVRGEDRKAGRDANALLGLRFAVQTLADEDAQAGVPGASKASGCHHGLLGGDIAAAVTAEAAADRPDDADVAIADVTPGLGHALLQGRRLGALLLAAQ